MEMNRARRERLRTDGVLATGVLAINRMVGANDRGTERDEIFVPEDEHLTCSICLERMNDREVMSTLRCQHTFHHECIDAWLTATLQTPLVEPSCPECRADLQVVRLSTVNRTTVAPTTAQVDV